MQQWFAVLRSIFGDNVDVSENGGAPNGHFDGDSYEACGSNGTTGIPGYPIPSQLEHAVTHVHLMQLGPCWNDGQV